MVYTAVEINKVSMENQDHNHSIFDLFVKNNKMRAGVMTNYGLSILGQPKSFD
jgi:hypothetical protein